MGTNQYEANDILIETMHKIRAGVYITSSEGKTFKEFAEEWLKGKVKIKDRTKISYEGIVNNHLIPYFGDGRISDLKRQNIKDFIGAKVEENKLSPKSIHNILLVLHQIISDAQVEGLMIHNPYVKIEKPKREKPEVDYLRTHEIPIFLKACEAVCDTTKYSLFHVAIFTGLRRGEFLGLQWGDIDWINQKIHVRRSLYKRTFQSPKSEYSKRAIDMGPRLVQILKEHRTKQNKARLKAGDEWINNDLVFCQKNGVFLDADNLYHRDLRAVLKKAGLRAIRIHDLRHTFAAILISAGHNFKYIQNQMGHSSIQVTLDLYGHLMPEVFEGAAKKSEDFVFSGVSGNVMVTEDKKGSQTNLQPLGMFGSGG